jgi:hypothetical protein
MRHPVVKVEIFVRFIFLTCMLARFAISTSGLTARIRGSCTAARRDRCFIDRCAFKTDRAVGLRIFAALRICFNVGVDVIGSFAALRWYTGSPEPGMLG